jgi:mono/diheme cytochrome c family protein
MGGLLTAVVLTLSGCVLVDRGPPSAEDGRQLYLRACASCHGSDARGGGRVARALAVPPPDLTLLTARHGAFPRDFVVAVIAGEREFAAHGDREMPVWSLRFGPTGAGAVASTYNRRRLEALADHLEAVQQR